MIFAKAAINSVLSLGSSTDHESIRVKLEDGCHIYKIDDLSYAIPIVNGDTTAITGKDYAKLPFDTEKIYLRDGGVCFGYVDCR